MCVYNIVLALHLDTTALSDGTYELIPESDGGNLEAQVNTAELTEAPDQSSEEPRAEIVSPTVFQTCVLGYPYKVEFRFRIVRLS